MRNSMHPLSSQHGAVLIHVAIALLGLVAFSAFVADYGIMWVSRSQVQTAADSAALSGAISLAFDGSTDFDGAKARAQAMSTVNPVFGQAPDIQLTDVTFPPCPPFTPGLPDTCVKVDAFRNQARSNPLPMFFGKMVGVNNQGVRATATAQIVTGDTTDCLKPWAILDRWDEFGGGAEPNYPNPDFDFQPDSTYDKYSDGKGQNPAPEPDLYVPPSASGAGTGFRLPADEGRRFAVKVGSNQDANTSSGWFRAIRLPRLDGQAGGDVYRDNISTCGGLPSTLASSTTVCPASISIADAATWATKGCFAVETGNMVGPTAQGIEGLVAKDTGASWSGGRIVGSAFSPSTSSPRVVPIGVIDIGDYLSKDPNGAGGVLKMVNIYGYFIEGMGDVAADGTMTLNKNGKSVIGRIMTIPATGSGSSTLPAEASFLRQIILVR